MIYEELPDGYKNHPILKSLAETIKKNYDGREKYIGDRVKIWDRSGCFDEKNSLISYDEYFLKGSMIVIGTDSTTHDIPGVDGVSLSMVTDLVLYEPISGKKITTHSDFCGLHD